MPDVWIDRVAAPHPRRPSGAVGPPRRVAAKSARARRRSAGAGRLVLNVRLDPAGHDPDPQAILPYRHALVVNEYESWTSSRERMRRRRSDRAVGDPRQQGAAGGAQGCRHGVHADRGALRRASGARGRTAPLRQREVTLPLYYDHHPPVADGLQLVSLPLLLPSGRAAAVLRRPAAGAAPDADDRQLHLLRLGEPAVLVPAAVLHARRLHRGARDRSGRTAHLVAPDPQARPGRPEDRGGSEPR